MILKILCSLSFMSNIHPFTVTMSVIIREFCDILIILIITNASFPFSMENPLQTENNRYYPALNN